MALDFRNYLCCSYYAFSKAQGKTERKDCTPLVLLLTTSLWKYYITTLGERPEKDSSTEALWLKCQQWGQVGVAMTGEHCPQLKHLGRKRKIKRWRSRRVQKYTEQIGGKESKAALERSWVLELEEPFQTTWASTQTWQRDKPPQYRKPGKSLSRLQNKQSLSHAEHPAATEQNQNSNVPSYYVELKAPPKLPINILLLNHFHLPPGFCVQWPWQEGWSGTWRAPCHCCHGRASPSPRSHVSCWVCLQGLPCCWGKGGTEQLSRAATALLSPAVTMWFL